MNEDVVIVLSSEPLRPPVSELGRLVPDHLTRLQEQSVDIVLVILDEEWPASSVLSNIENGTATR